MKRRDFLASSLLGSAGLLASRFPFAQSVFGATTRAPGRKILIAGGGYNTPFIRYMAQLTGKPRPKLLYLPTASADSANGIIALVPDLRAAQRRADRCRRASSPARDSRRAGRRCCSRRRHRLLGRQHAQSAGDLEGAGHRRRAAPGVGPRHRPRRRQRRLAVLVRGGHDRLATEGAVEGAVPRLPQGQPLAALRRRAGAAAAVSEADRLGRDEAGLRVRQRRRHLLRGQRGQARGLDAADAKVYYVSVVGGKVVERVMEPESIA